LENITSDSKEVTTSATKKLFLLICHSEKADMNEKRGKSRAISW